MSVLTVPVAGILAKLSWTVNLKASKTNIKFSAPYDLKELVGIIFGKEVGYRSDTFDRFIDIIFKTHGTENGHVSISHTAFIFLLFILLYILLNKFTADKLDVKEKAKCVYIITGFTTVVYTAGLMASYMYKFTQHEAKVLGSFNRYMAIIEIALIAMSVFVSVYSDTGKDKSGKVYVAAILWLLVTLPLNNHFADMVSKNYVNRSVTVTSQRRIVADKILSIESEKCKVAPIFLTDTEYNLYRMEYFVYPNYVGEEMPISVTIKTENNYYNTWMRKKAEYTSQQLTHDFQKYGYDYLALAVINEDFINEYREAFENYHDIAEGNIFRLNEETGKFYLVA